jgi:NADH-quinone oxidoreductase subunit N
MFFDEPAQAFEPVPGALKAVLLLATIVTAFFVVWPALINGPAALAAASLWPAG